MKEDIKGRLRRWAIWKERMKELGYATETTISKMMQYGELIGTVVYEINGIDYSDECHMTNLAVNKLSQDKIIIINDHYFRKGKVEKKRGSHERQRYYRILKKIYKELDKLLDEVYDSLANLSPFC